MFCKWPVDDESDDDEDEDQADKWQSDEESEAEESESNSESDDSTYGKKKKKGGFAAKPKMPDFVLGASSTKGKGKGGVKRKKRRIDDDDVDKAWNSVSDSSVCKDIKEKSGLDLKQFSFRPPKKI